MNKILGVMNTDNKFSCYLKTVLLLKEYKPYHFYLAYIHGQMVKFVKDKRYSECLFKQVHLIGQKTTVEVIKSNIQEFTHTNIGHCFIFFLLNEDEKSYGHRS